MHFLVVVGSGVVASFFGPFASKVAADEWCKETETDRYIIVMCYPPTGLLK